MTYIDGFVAPVLPGRRDDFIATARETSALFLEHGALEVVEGYGDDVPRGRQTDLWRAVDAQDGEDVAFSWIVWPSKAARDAGWAKLMDDPRMNRATDMAFDAKRMIFGGLTAV